MNSGGASIKYLTGFIDADFILASGVPE